MGCKPHDLEFYIDNSGYRIDYICEELGMTRATFLRKRKDVTLFKKCEIMCLCLLLNIPDDERNVVFLI